MPSTVTRKRFIGLSSFRSGCATSNYGGRNSSAPAVAGYVAGIDRVTTFGWPSGHFVSRSCNVGDNVATAKSGGHSRSDCDQMMRWYTARRSRCRRSSGSWSSCSCCICSPEYCCSFCLEGCVGKAIANRRTCCPEGSQGDHDNAKARQDQTNCISKHRYVL